MESRLNASEADWRVIVTHFPPSFRSDFWAQLAEKYDVDLIVTGHRHQQELSDRDPQLGNAAWVVSGGGGGITSEGMPREDGDDDMYGFMDVTISKSEMKIEALSHSGIIRKTVTLQPRRLTSTTTATATLTTTTSTSATTSTRSFRHHDAKTGEDTSGTRRGSLLHGLVGVLLALAACMVH